MKFKELAQMNKGEREKKLKELELELIKLNAQVATGTPPKNAGQLKRLKKDIAKMMLLKGIDEKIVAQKGKLMPKPELKTVQKPVARSQSKQVSDKVSKERIDTNKKPK